MIQFGWTKNSNYLMKKKVCEEIQFRLRFEKSLRRFLSLFNETFLHHILYGYHENAFEKFHYDNAHLNALLRCLRNHRRNKVV